jgi:hypothetical protein
MAAVTEETSAPLSVGDRTRPGIAVAPPAASNQTASMARMVEMAAARGDQTQPGIALPPASRVVELPSIKRRMATPGSSGSRRAPDAR